MDISGKVFKMLPLQKGAGKNGEWKKQDFVVETTGQYPKKVCFALWGDKIDQYNLSEGQDLTVHFEAESREFNGKWYTDLKAWKIDTKGSGSGSGSIPDHSFPAESDFPEKDDLPF